MTDTPAWLARYGLQILRWGKEGEGHDPLEKASLMELQRLNDVLDAALDRIAVLESGQREMETRLPTEGGS